MSSSDSLQTLPHSRKGHERDLKASFEHADVVHDSAADSVLCKVWKV